MSSDKPRDNRSIGDGNSEGNVTNSEALRIKDSIRERTSSIFVYTHMHTFVHIYVCAYMHKYMCIYGYTHILYECFFAYVDICTGAYVDIDIMDINILIFINVLIYVDMCIY